MKKVIAIVASVLALGAAMTASAADNHNHDDYLAQKKQAFGK
ncbi:hypothetical protein [Leeia speluncae]|nr:hypothetical protein [Leeia speluncae]